MSVLEEPPMDRIPIQTYVMEYNEEMIREAIHRGAGQRWSDLLYLQSGKEHQDITDKIVIACAGGQCGLCSRADA